MKKKLVVLTGAGISAESGIKTFRDADGLWEGHDVTEVASPEGWEANQDLVLDFYNQRRKQLHEVQPNKAHQILAELEQQFDVTIVTQNVDDLHERGGSNNVIHLHGELKKVRSTGNPNLIYELTGWELKKGDVCEEGYQLRPHIVWFGEAVPMMDEAIKIAQQADVFLVVGTSMLVYPAAGLIQYVSQLVPKFIIDPQKPDVHFGNDITFIEEKATSGMEKVRTILLNGLK